MTAPHTRTGYTTVDPSEGEQAKPCYPDPVMDAVRRCAEIAASRRSLPSRDIDVYGTKLALDISEAILAEFGLLPTSET